MDISTTQKELTERDWTKKRKKKTSIEDVSENMLKNMGANM